MPFDIFTKLLDLNPLAGRFVALGVMVLAAAALVAGFGEATDSLVRVGLYILGFAVLVVILVKLQGLPSRILGWVLTVGFTVWFSTMVLQIVSGNSITYLASTPCLIYPFSEACVAVSSGTVVSPPEGAPENPNAAPNATSRVYIQFAGSIARGDVVEFAQLLSSDGWSVEDMDRGGERTGRSAGLNEVRFFHEEDRSLAEALAVRSSEASPAGTLLTVRSLAGTRFTTADTKGLLEIWISN